MNQALNAPTLNELASIGATHGVRITPEWLRKRIRQGFLPDTPQLPRLGRGKGRPEPRYASNMALQLTAFFAAEKQFGKNLGAVGWALFKSGYQVDPRYWRGQLESRAKEWETIKRKLAGDNFNHAILNDLMAGRDRGPIIGQARRTLRDRARNFLEIFLGAAMGEYVSVLEFQRPEEPGPEPGWFQRTFRIPASDKNAPIDVVNLDQWISRISDWARIDIYEWLKPIPDAEIITAADEILSFVRAAAEFNLFAPKSVQTALALWVLSALSRNHKIESAVVLGWLEVRRNEGFPDSIRNLTAQLRDQINRTKQG
jgi:hypothetical protein